MNELQVNEIRVDLVEDFSARKEAMENCIRNIKVLENVNSWSFLLYCFLNLVVGNLLSSKYNHIVTSFF